MRSELSPSRTEMEQAFYHKDASYDGVFFVAVRTTGIFCRPSCPSRPKLENVEFFSTLREAIFASYRPCKRCHPMEVYGALPDWVVSLTQQVEAAPNAKITAAELRAIGISPERARRWFREHYGMTFAEWCRGRRLADAFTRIREGTPLADVVFANGYESHSGFREAFGKTFGVSPGQSQTSDYIAAQILETPLGALLVGAVSEGVCLIEYTDRRMLEHNYATIRKRFGHPVLPVTNEQIEHLRDELTRYFAGTLTKFTVPLVPQGTAFQERVWSELQRIPYGQTIAYDQLARRIEQPTAVRAVARANGMNRINILIPCHRVIGKDGQLTGYGGGLWRKRLLLELERTGKLPGIEAV
ncbi:bifunctional transcriptional activator/DNA repair enzyme AdaA [Leptolyngbya sp. FACHB-261]|uniref:bifunctional transcriptional activator/DNA repair enzyme AdaA n=1 Tax=Leptolyngbya sp. FACHB-261 TaxID=2692806 RepID=UPI0018EF6B69|nr:methylated-DNA--[protein]-cysteine S-methyltransferase [Leptolyngbya sp. FACHB-261]